MPKPFEGRIELDIQGDHHVPTKVGYDGCGIGKLGAATLDICMVMGVR
jgi:hypothetical protein